MTDKLRETFDIAPSDERPKVETKHLMEDVDEKYEERQADIEKYQEKTALVHDEAIDILRDVDLQEHDQQMDEVMEAAGQAHEETYALAMNMNPKDAGSVLEQSQAFLKLKMDAATKKIDIRRSVSKTMMEIQRQKDKNNQASGPNSGDVSINAAFTELLDD